MGPGTGSRLFFAPPAVPSPAFGGVVGRDPGVDHVTSAGGHRLAPAHQRRGQFLGRLDRALGLEALGAANMAMSGAGSSMRNPIQRFSGTLPRCSAIADPISGAGSALDRLSGLLSGRRRRGFVFALGGACHGLSSPRFKFFMADKIP